MNSTDVYPAVRRPVEPALRNLGEALRARSTGAGMSAFAWLPGITLRPASLWSRCCARVRFHRLTRRGCRPSRQRNSRNRWCRSSN